MKAVKYSYEEHYSVIYKWWKGHDWTPVAPGILPRGYIIKSDNGHYICAGFLYETVGTPLHSLEWVISNPIIDKRELSKGLDLMFKSLLALTKRGDLIMSFASNKSLIKRYVENGFVEPDQGMTTLIKVNK